MAIKGNNWKAELLKKTFDKNFCNNILRAGLIWGTSLRLFFFILEAALKSNCEVRWSVGK